MTDQLKYCCSLQFFERCKSAGHSDDSIATGHFHSRVRQALMECLARSEEEGTSYDAKAVLESIFHAIDWKDLFADHNHNLEGRGAENIRTALMEVLNALAVMLVDTNLKIMLLFLAWADHRDKSDSAMMWSSSDDLLYRYVGMNYIEQFGGTTTENRKAKSTWMQLIKTCTIKISTDIETSFAIDSQSNASFQDETYDMTLKMESIKKARCWVQLLRDFNEATRNALACELSFSLLHVMSTLDNVDVKNLDLFDNRKNKARKGNNLHASSSSRKRHRLPSGTRSSDIFAAMHDGSLDLGDDRNHRVKLALMQHENCASMQVSLKQILNATAASIQCQQTAGEATHECRGSYHNTLETYNQSSGITTLTVAATRLRRDLYLYLIEQDSKDIGKQEELDGTIDCKLTKLISNLVARLKCFSSPSIRLYTIMTLDQLRQLHLGDKGYVLFMNDLLKRIYLQDDHNEDKDFYLRLYTDIASECDVYAHPRRLISALASLMEMSVLPSFRNSNFRVILQSIGHILLRRKIILSRLNSDELKKYHQLSAKVSVEYDDPSFWVSQTRTRAQNFELIAILQSCGILGLFHNYNLDDDEVSNQSQTTKPQFPYDNHMSLRSTHVRLGPCHGFNDILSNPFAHVHKSPEIEQYSTSSCEKEALTPLSSIDDNGVLHVVFDFLGYRSLTRASQCCKAWRNAAMSSKRWCRLYFHKFRGAMMEEELSSAEALKFDDLDKRILLPMSIEGLNWFTIFKHQYISDKLVRSRSIGKTWKSRICPFVGCNMLICSEHHMTGHLNRHMKQSRVLMKKREKFQTLKVKVKQLHQALDGDLACLNPVSPDRNTKPKLDTPELIMLHLIFPFLNVYDLTRPVCKLWTELGQSNLIWYNLYCCHFGEPCIKWLVSTPSTLNKWKIHFKNMYQTKRLVSGDSSMLGYKYQICRVLGCCEVLGSKLDHDIHVTEHEVNYMKKLCLRQRKAKRLKKSKVRFS